MSAPAASRTNELLMAALDAARRGWLVFPLHSLRDGVCTCHLEAACDKRPGKHPRTAHGFKDATTDPDVIRSWWNRWPDANIGIATGPASRLFVIDIDPAHGGDKSLIELERRLGALPVTFCVHTGGGGWHFYFLWPEGYDIPCTESDIAPGIDTRGRGGYIVAALSLHKSGKLYEIHDAAVFPVACPESWLQEICEKRVRPGEQGAPTAPGAVIPIGMRRARILRLAGPMVWRGMTKDAILAALQIEINETFENPETVDDVAPIVDDFMRRDREKRAAAQAASETASADGADVGKEAQQNRPADDDRAEPESSGSETPPNVIEMPRFRPAAVPVPEVIEEIEALFRKYVIMPEAAYLIVALWIIATYCATAFDVFPYLNLRSPAKRCGKTRVLELIQPLTANSWMIVVPSAATIFRMMKTEPTLLLDEVETLTAGSGKGGLSEAQQNLLAIFNMGYKKGATVPRCEGPKHKVVHFPVYGPKAFGSTKPVPDTLGDRCVCISMQRRLPSQKIERYLIRKVAAPAQKLATEIAQSVAAARASIEQMYVITNDLPYLNDRDAEIFIPLFAVCSVLAPSRVAEFEKAAKALTGAKAAADTESSTALQLLVDIQGVLGPDEKNIGSEDLVRRLCAIEESPWAEYKLTQKRLAIRLRPFDLVSGTVRVSNNPLSKTTAKGYKREELETVFKRYLPPVKDDREGVEGV